jgi:polyhydroxyalkanoate synthesis regulator phasin/DNA-dependent RNA polymerase auxiliary subunit epsilon
MSRTRTKNRPKEKAESRYYVVRTAQDLRKNVTERVENYHQEFIKDPIESGKEFVGDLREDPRKTLNTLVDDSRKFVGGLKKDTRKRVDGVVAGGRKLYKKARKNPRKTFAGMMDDGRDVAKDLIEDGKSVMTGVEKDARIALSEIADSGKKALDNLPGKKKLQKTIVKRMKSVPAQFNLPTRKDMDTLMKRLEGLTTKIDTLAKEYAA